MIEIYDKVKTEQVLEFDRVYYIVVREFGVPTITPITINEVRSSIGNSLDAPGICTVTVHYKPLFGKSETLYISPTNPYSKICETYHEAEALFAELITKLNVNEYDPIISTHINNLKEHLKKKYPEFSF